MKAVWLGLVNTEKKKWLLLTWASLKPNATSLNYLPIVNVIPAFIFPGLAQSVHDKNT